MKSTEQRNQAATIRSIKPTSFASQPPKGTSSVLKTNIKGMLTAQASAQTKRTNYGERQKHRNRNLNPTGPPIQITHQSQPSSRAYSSTKPAVRQQQKVFAGRTEAAPSLDTSMRQTRAQSKRNVPSHLFHPQTTDLTQQDLSYVTGADQDLGYGVDMASQNDSFYQAYGSSKDATLEVKDRQKNKTLKINRENIQVPLGQTNPVPSQRKGSTVKRHSLATSQTSRNQDHTESAKQVQNRLKKQMATLKNLSSHDNLKVISEVGHDPAKQRRGSSLLRDQSMSRRRKSSSNPRQKLASSNLRPMQLSHNEGRPLRQGQTTARVKLGQKYGYKHGGPIEAYQTVNTGERASSFLDPDQLRTVNTTSGVQKKMSQHHMLPHMCQTSQDVNPLNLQHLSSIERAGSIDSAGYEMSSAQISTKVGQPWYKGGNQGQTITPKAGQAYDTIQSREESNAAQSIKPASQGFSEMLKQTIMIKAQQSLSQGTEQVDPEIEAALLSLDQSQATQNLMKEFINAQNEPSNLRKGSLPTSVSDAITIQQSQNGNSRLEHLIQQLITRKEITQSPNIQQNRRTMYGNEAITAAHHSLHAPYQIREIAGTNPNVTNFNSSMHTNNGPSILEQKFSAEDLLRIARENTKEVPVNKSPPKHRQQMMPPKTYRATGQNGLATFGNKQSAAGKTNRMMVNHTEEIDMTDTFGAAGNGQNTQQIVAQAFSAISNSDTKEQHREETQKAADLYSDLYKDNTRHKFLSLDQQPHKTTLGSEGSIDEIYHKTLSAYQNDINQLNEINRTKKEISSRIMKHQNLLQSIQGAATKEAPSSASAVLIESVANSGSVVQSNQASVVGGAQHPLPPSHLDTIGLQNMTNTGYNSLTTKTQHGVQSKATNQSTIVGYSQRGSFIENNTDNLAKSKIATVTTSPIVGRYRLKHIQPQTKRQHAYDTAQSIPVGNTAGVTKNQGNPVEKRTRSVRPRRPGQNNLTGGGSNLRGGSRKDQTKTGTQVRTKFDSIAQAYNSTNMIGRDDYASNSQRSLLGLGSTQMQQPQQQQNKRQMQNLEVTMQQHKNTTLQQTYGAVQKLQSGATSTTSTIGAKRSTVTSVPRQRQGQGFASNMRPPVVKQTERSLSHNRNRGQQSFQHTNSFVAQHTYMSANNGIANSQNKNTAMHVQQLHGSVQHPIAQGFNPNMSEATIKENLLMQSAISPISTAQNRSFKYRSKQAAQQGKRTGKKSTSRGRGTTVANSTQLVGPGARKQSRITQVIPNNSDINQIQMSQQQVQNFRGSFIQNQNQIAGNRSFRLSSGHLRNNNPMGDSRLSPNPTFNSKDPKGTYDQRALDATPDQLKQKSPLHLRNKISRKTSPDNRLQSNEDADLSGQMSIGGQEIGQQAPAAGNNVQPFMRTHNLRYSSTVNDFGELRQPSQPVQQTQEKPAGVSKETQELQNQAMKLINEDNPFESPSLKDNADNAVNQKNEAEKQIMSFGDDSNKSIAEKTTERESKNTNMTFAGVTSAAQSGTLSNQFGMSKQSQQNKRIIIGGPSGSNIGGLAQRRSLLGLAAMRRSETTEDSQQCTYNDSNIIMSSLPMPMESIRQVIAEEEAAEEQDDKTTNKESSKLIKKVNNTGKEGKSSSSNKDKVSSDDTKRQLSTPVIQSDSNYNNSIKDESNVHIVDDSDSVHLSESNQVVMLESGNVQTPQLQANSTGKGMTLHQERPNSHKQSDRYSERLEQKAVDSEDHENMLCESETSVQFQGKAVEMMTATPDPVANKDNKPKGNASYNRGAFWSRSNEFIDEWPAPLSESVASKQRKNTGSEAHSDDEIEVRRGLESENARTDMGSNPELLRQSTHSLLHKPTQAKEEEAKYDKSYTADMFVMNKRTKHADESNENLISDEINVQLSHQSRFSRKVDTRNNNYFKEDSVKSPDVVKKSIEESVIEDDDDESELMVGMVDDAEEFKLGKII